MNWRKWLDEFVLAGKGILLATRLPRFWVAFCISFIFFGMLMNLLSGGTAKFELMFALGFPESLQILGSAFLSIFGVNQAFLDWLPIFAISVLQSILIGIIVVLWQKKSPKKVQKSAKTEKSAESTKFSVKSRKTEQKTERNSAKTEHAENASNLGSAGLITGLIALGAGCPTCGVTLLTPLLGAIFSTGSLAIAGAVSTVLTWLAVIIAILSLKRLGEEFYVIMINEKYLAKKRRKTNENIL